MGKARFSSFISTHQTDIEALLSARLGAGHMEWKEAWALFCRSSQTRKGGRPQDMHSITSVHAKGTHPPALFLHSSNLSSWTTPCSGLWTFALSIFPASTLPKPPSLPTLCVWLNLIHLLDFSWDVIFSRKMLLTPPTWEVGSSVLPWPPSTNHFPYVAFFVIQSEFPAYSSISPCRLRSLWGQDPYLLCSLYS